MLLNMDDLTITQLNALIFNAHAILERKVETKRLEHESGLNQRWTELNTLITSLTPNYAVMMRVKDKSGRVRHFNLADGADVQFELMPHNKEQV